MSTNLDAIFKPKSIAVIGASNKPGSIGSVIVNNLLRFEYRGNIYPVNPKTDKIQWLRCYPTVADIPEPIDQAIIVVPRDFVKDALEQCGKQGVKGVVTITAGFKEIGGEGIVRENELIEIIKRCNMRMVGPNCYGVVNTADDISLNSTFSKLNPLRGKVAFMSQSGALGEVVIDYTNKLHLGISMFASVGNKADISDNDILRYWKDDPTTEIILLYLENIEQPGEFIELAREISRRKPIFAVKAGRTAAGARAISSHTGVLAGGDAATDAVFRQCGIIRAPSIDELFDMAMAFANQPLLKGGSIAVITNAGGPGILATDAVESSGLKMAKFDKNTIEFLRANLMAVAAVNNPIDVIASGGPDAYGVAVEGALKDSNVDGLIVIFVPPILVDSRAVLKAMADKVRELNCGKTVLACLMGSPDGIAGAEYLRACNIPTYLFPESAARALAGMNSYRAWLAKPKGKKIDFKVKSEAARKIFERSAGAKNKTILGIDALKILAAYGIPVVKSAVAENQHELSKTIAAFEFPLVMKIDDPAIIHKTEAGGVVTGINSRAEALKAFKSLQGKSSIKRGAPVGLLVQKMITGGVEVIMGMNSDPTFGPLLMFGLGGIHVELLKDVAFRVNPITERDAAEMVEEVKGYPLLAGFRGSKNVNIKLLAETLLRLSRLVADFPQIKSLDINPFIVCPAGKKSAAVDARMILG